jgi:hypothetical protein
MARANDREVPAIERRDLRLTEPLARDHHPSVDKAQIQGFVGALDLGGSNQAILVEVVEAVGAGRDVFDEGLPGARSVQLAQPVVHLYEHDCRYDKVLADLVDHRDAALMLGIGRVEQCHDRPGVEDERHS